MENYVKVKALVFGQNKEYRTAMKEGSAKKKDNDNRIHFNETINIDVPAQSSRDCVLEVAVMDEDMTSDEVCGVGKINADHCGLFQPGSNSYVLHLYDPKKN